MVYNVHQLTHLTKCVEMNGPLFAYSNYSMEDNIGHLASFVKGTTDVSSQICSRYLLEKNLHLSLRNSPLAQSFYEQIESKLSFAVTRKIDGSLMIGKPSKNCLLNDCEKQIIKNELNIRDSACITEYGSVLLKCHVFYETAVNSRKKRTNDSFIVNSISNRFGVIKSIFTVNEKVYFFVDEIYEVENSSDSIYVTLLKKSITSQQKIFCATDITQKYVLVDFENTVAMSRFPNIFEKN